MTETEKAKLIIEISKLTVIAKEIQATGGIVKVPVRKIGRKIETEAEILDVVPMEKNYTIACVKLKDVLKLISDWGVEE